MDKQNGNKNRQPHTHFLTETALLACGFEQATRSSAPNQIWNIKPKGGTALRDALIYGNRLLAQLHNLLEVEHKADDWAFLHIIVTDGHDTDSKASVQETARMLAALRGNLNVRALKIIILGVDIEDGFAQSLRSLISLAGQHGEYHDITHTDMHQMFHRIRTNAGLNNRSPSVQNLSAMQKNPYQINEPQSQYYAVLFTLDISGSMTGHKWDVVRHATSDFINYLENRDLVSVIVFNDSPHLVMHFNTQQKQTQLIQMEARILPFEEVMNNQAYFDPNEFKEKQKYVENNPYKNGLQSATNINGREYFDQTPPSKKPLQSQEDNSKCCCCF